MPPRNASFNLLERNGRYYASIYDPNRHPKQIQRTLRTSDKSTARRKLTDWERAYTDGKFDPWKQDRRDGVSVQEAVEAYRAHRRKQGDAPTSKRTRGSRLDKFVEHVDADRPIRSVRAQTIRDLFDSIPGRFGDEPAPATLLSYYGTLAGFFSWCIEEGLMRPEDDPMDEVTRPKTSGDNFTILSVSELEEIRHTVLVDTRPSPADERKNRRRFRRYMLGVADFAVASMARRSEICSLRWQQVRFQDDGTAYVRIQNYPVDEVEDGVSGFTVKNTSSARSIFVPPRGGYVLRRLYKSYEDEHGEPPPPERIVFRSAWDKPLKNQTVSKLWAEYVRESSVARRVRFHDLRHTAISWALNDLDVPLAHVQEMAGHATADRTLSYQMSGERSMRDAYLRVSGQAPEGKTGSHEEVRDFLWRKGEYAPNDNELKTELLQGARTQPQ